MFFLPVLPLSGVFLLVAVLLVQLCERYLFTRVYKRPNEASGRIALNSIFALGFGNIILFVSFGIIIDIDRVL